MSSFERTCHIEVPLPQTWDYLTRWEDSQDWRDGIDELTPAKPPQKGVMLVGESRGKPFNGEITEWNPPLLLEIMIQQTSVKIYYRYDLLETPEGCDVRCTIRCECEGTITKHASSTITTAIQRAEYGHADALKTYVEWG